MYANILVPISFDDERKVEAALTAARCLADEAAQVTLLHVVEHVPAYALRYIPQDLVTATREGLLAELNRLAEPLPGAAGAVIEGHAGRSILEFAAGIEADCIVVASHRPAMQDYLLGSTAAQVVRHAPCTVLVIR